MPLPHCRRHRQMRGFLQDCSGAWDIWMDQPAVLKPQKLWTGKQVRVEEGAGPLRRREP